MLPFIDARRRRKRSSGCPAPVSIGLGVALALLPLPLARAADLVLKLRNADAVRWVGAIRRFDSDGNRRRAVDPKAKIDAPAVDQVAKQRSADEWRFTGLEDGRYDLVLLTRDHRRIEGFYYPPVDEFDPVVPGAATAPREIAEWIVDDIAKSRHYENKVTPLYLGGNEKQVRILVQLLRDKPTSYDAQFGQPVATLRHEVWQYKNRYGGWVKDRKTKVLDRILLGKNELARWTWIWEPKLGGIEVGRDQVEIEFTIPRTLSQDRVRGLLPGLKPVGYPQS